MRVAVTGATGFIGRALMPALAARGHEAVALPRAGFAPGLVGAAAVIHLAGLAHRTGADAPSPAAFKAANTDLPLSVYAAAREAGMAQMIHVSTIAVVGGNSGPLREDSPLAPTTAYDRAKAAAETALLAAAGPALTIVRPPLVYGPGAKGNLQSLMRLCRLPVPLPFASVRNRRSMVARANLVDALMFLLDHPGRGIVHVTDARDLSLRDLVAHIRAGLGRAPRMFPLPPAAMRGALRLAGSGRMADQLFGDQVVEMETLTRLGWRPVVSPEAELKAMAAAFAAGATAASAPAAAP